MLAPRNMSPQQIDWLGRMRASLEYLHQQWYDKMTGQRMLDMDDQMFKSTDLKIRAAAARLNIEVEDVGTAAERNDFWDDEENGNLVVLGDALDAIVRHFWHQDTSRPDPQAEKHFVSRRDRF